jgi:hypothetical protein
MRSGLENRAIESRAGLARVSLALGDVHSASNYVEEILQHLQSKDLTSTEEPLCVYLTCYQVLRANQDLRAVAILEGSYRFLLDLANTIGDPALRSSFLNAVPSNRQILERWQELADGGN